MSAPYSTMPANHATIGQATLFASRSWFEHWLHAFGDGDCGWWPKSAALGFHIPYCIRRQPIGPLAIRVARAAANSHTPRFDIVGDALPTAHQFKSMMGELNVSVLVFPYVSDCSLLARGIADARNSSSLIQFTDHCEIAPYVDCTGEFEAYLDSRGKSRKTSWLYYERRSIKAGATFQVLTTWEDIERVFDEVLAVEASGWKGDAGTSISQNANVRAFYTNMCRDFAKQDRLRVFLLQRDGKVVAFQICTLYEGTLSCIKIGYLEDYAKDSPGQVIQLQIVRWAFSIPEVRIFDMLGPASDTKLKWSTETETLRTHYLFSKTPAGFVAAGRWKWAPELKRTIRSRFASSSQAPTGGDPPAENGK